MDRAQYMTPADQAKVKPNTPRRHDVMLALTGKARPGKTAKDRANRGRSGE
jgi:hypothetical protein